MKFDHTFTLNLPIADAWRVLTDVPMIAPCMPGAKLEGAEGETYKGVVKVKVGPITTQYRGQATIVEKDDAAYRMVLDGKGSDTTGQGGANAHVVGQLKDAGGGRTQVDLTTDLQISGKVAQLGAGMIKDVSSRLLQQFVTNLEAKLKEGQTSSPAADAAHLSDQQAAMATPGDPSEPRSVIHGDDREVEAIDVGALGASAFWDRYGLKIALGVIIILQLVILVRQ